MKKFLSFAMLMTFLSADIINIHPGWQLMGSPKDLNVKDLNLSGEKIIWIYDDFSKKWMAYSPNSDLMNKIKNLNIKTFSVIPKYKGFWIFSDDFINISINNSETNELFDSPIYTIPLKNINLSDIANKSFIFIPLNKNITFDENGHASFTFNNVNNEEMINISLNGGSLFIKGFKNYEGNDIVEKYKILSENNIGIVLGNLEKPQLIALIYKNAIPNLQDMSKEIPYKLYPNVTFNTDGSISGTYCIPIVGCFGDLNYSIENKKFKITYSPTEDQEYVNYLQINYKIGDFDILKNETYEIIKSSSSIAQVGGCWVKYDPETNETEGGCNPSIYEEGDIKIDLNETRTWHQFFEKTDWTFEGDKFYENNLTTALGGKFKISNDDKKLTIQYPDKNETIIFKDGDLIKTIESKKLLLEYYFINPTIPIYKK